MTKSGKILTKECYLPTTLLFLTHDCDTVASMPPALPHHHLADQYQYAWKKYVIDWVMSQSGTGEWWPWPQPPLVLWCHYWHQVGWDCRSCWCWHQPYVGTSFDKEKEPPFDQVGQQHAVMVMAIPKSMYVDVDPKNPQNTTRLQYHDNGHKLVFKFGRSAVADPQEMGWSDMVDNIGANQQMLSFHIWENEGHSPPATLMASIMVSMYKVRAQHFWSCGLVIKLYDRAHPSNMDGAHWQWRGLHLLFLHTWWARHGHKPNPTH